MAARLKVAARPKVPARREGAVRPKTVSTDWYAVDLASPRRIRLQTERGSGPFWPPRRSRRVPPAEIGAYQSVERVLGKGDSREGRQLRIRGLRTIRDVGRPVRTAPGPRAQAEPQPRPGPPKVPASPKTVSADWYAVDLASPRRIGPRHFGSDYRLSVDLATSVGPAGPAGSRRPRSVRISLWSGFWERGVALAAQPRPASRVPPAASRQPRRRALGTIHGKPSHRVPPRPATGSGGSPMHHSRPTHLDSLRGGLVLSRSPRLGRGDFKKGGTHPHDIDLSCNHEFPRSR